MARGEHRVKLGAKPHVFREMPACRQTGFASLRRAGGNAPHVFPKRDTRNWKLDTRS